MSDLTCSNCGKTMPIEGAVCPYCHADKSEDVARHSQKEQAIGLGAVVGGVAGLIVGCALRAGDIAWCVAMSGALLGGLVGGVVKGAAKSKRGERCTPARNVHFGDPDEPVHVSYCPSCGLPVEANHLFCARCGARVRERLEVETDSDRRAFEEWRRSRQRAGDE